MATAVLDQAHFVSKVENAPSGTESDQGFSEPFGVSFIKGRLYVSDFGKGRVMVFPDL